MKSAFEAHNADFLRAAHLEAMRAGEFDRTFRRLRTGGKQKNLVQPFRRQPGQTFHQRRALFTGETVIVKQPLWT